MLKLFKGENSSKITKQATSADNADKPSENLENNFAILNNLPTNVLICEPDSAVIIFANDASKETLRRLEDHIPIKASEIVGTNIDVFHKVPSHQRNVIGNPDNLPHDALIQVGPETLDLHVEPSFDGAGNYTHAVLTWSVVTERENFRRDSEQLRDMVDKMPINAMMCDPETLEIIYMNDASRNTLKSLQQYLPVDVDNIMGTCIDVFHKNPEHQRRILRDPSNLPWSAKIQLGPETLLLEISAIMSANGNYIGPLATWSIVTHEVALQSTVTSSVDQVANEVTALEEQAAALSAVAEQNISLASQVASAADQATNNVQSVASATEEMSASIAEISSQVGHASDISNKAAERVSQASTEVGELSSSSDKISAVVNLINDIAEQTNLLALNATIEAARAGDAGKGFAVVASEVKSLANQTAQATEDISKQVEGIQTQTSDVVKAIDEIGAVIKEVSEIAAGISASTEQQGAATQEISRSVAEAASQTAEASSQMNEVSAAANQTSTSAVSVKSSSATLS